MRTGTVPKAGDRHNLRLGRYGENEAARYLKQRGYRILARNYRCPHGEIDIICSREGILVFVEVKTRISQCCGAPQEAVTPKKIGHIRHSALRFVAEKRLPFSELRFDVIAILQRADGWQLEHIESAF